MIDIRYWIWLSLALNPNFKNTEKILSAFGDAKEVYKADYDLLLESGLSESLAQTLSNKDVRETNSVYAYCTQNGIGLLPYDSPSYPERLKKISDPPVLLYYKGSLPDFDDNVCIATVGTRKITEYGRREAYTISYDLACAGAIVVSGLAKGIDGVCHRACIDAYGKTVAVLGSGIDVVYPKENDMLYAEVASNGAVITEFSPGTPPLSGNFPQRNRIMSGLCLGTLVLEADSRSGALITARTALSQGRDLFSLPGKVGELNSVGTNNLIKNGAKMVTGAIDVLEEYEALFPHRIRIENIPVSGKKYSMSHSEYVKPSQKKKDEPSDSKEPTSEDKTPFTEAPEPDTSSLDESYLKVLTRMKRHEPVSADALVCDELTVTEIMVALTVLEIGKFVTALPGGMYVRN